MGGALLRLAGCSEFLRNFAAKPQALSCFGVGADDSVRPYNRLTIPGASLKAPLVMAAATAHHIRWFLRQMINF